MKRCAYCNNEFEAKDFSREHVIPNGLLKLFPDQNITFTEEKAYKDNFGLVKKDVCTKCNNEELSELDDYGVNMIKENFLGKFGLEDTVYIKFNYNLLSRWLLKILYNNERVIGKSIDWFKNNIDYIMGKGQNKN